MHKEPNSYEKTNRLFERAVILLQENLQYLADQDKVSDKFIAMQNRIIKALVDYQHQTEKIIGALEWEVTELSIGKHQEIDRLTEIKEAFEALCIIHGIMDFPIWMNRGRKSLISQAVSDYRENIVTLPCTLKNKFEKLSEQEKQFLNSILSK